MHEYEYITPEDYDTALKNGISAKLLQNRIYAGWTKQRAITQPVKQVSENSFDKYKNVAVISRRTFCRRIAKGWEPFAAATTPPKAKSKLSKEHVKIAKENGIGKHTLNARIYIYNWPVEKAINTPVNMNLSKNKNKS